MKFFVHRITYGNPPGCIEGEVFDSLLKNYNLTLVEAGTRFSKRDYIVRQSDLIWLLNDNCIDRKEKLQTSMYTCGSYKHIKKWLIDKDFHHCLGEINTDKAYKLVYEDLCKNHDHVMAAFNGTLHPDDIMPQHYQVNMVIEEIVNRGTGKPYKTKEERQLEHALFLKELDEMMKKDKEYNSQKE